MNVFKARNLFVRLKIVQYPCSKFPLVRTWVSQHTSISSILMKTTFAKKSSMHKTYSIIRLKHIF